MKENDRLDPGREEKRVEPHVGAHPFSAQRKGGFGAPDIDPDYSSARKKKKKDRARFSNGRAGNSNMETARRVGVL